MGATSDCSPILLICTVGGTPDPIVQSLLYWHPARIVFLHTSETKFTVDEALRFCRERHGIEFPVGSCEKYPISDEEDFKVCIREVRRYLDNEVCRWLDRDSDHRVIVDFTGGTKCMSAALALVARRWKCTFSYIGGKQRTKEGVGVVVPGTEQVIQTYNPWEVLGYQTVEDVTTAFNSGSYAFAFSLLEDAVKKVEDLSLKRTLATLKSVVGAYVAWDRFDHQGALSRFNDAIKNSNDFLSLYPESEAREFTKQLEFHRDCVARLCQSEQPDLSWVIDLLQNADRRIREQRFDDAVARLYRAMEALAQILLRKYGIENTKSVPLDRLTATRRQAWANRASEGVVALGLQDAYCLLQEWGDPVGQKFHDLGLDDRHRSPLNTRNNSILAHGFQPVRKEVPQQLRQSLVELLKTAGQKVDGTDATWSLPSTILIGTLSESQA